MGNGFNCNAYSKNLVEVINKCAMETFGSEPLYFGAGGTIPFLNDI